MATRLLLLLVAFALPLQAAEVAGVKFDDSVRLADTALALSGAGLRQRFIFDVYAMGLYVRDAKSDLVMQPGAKRVVIRMLRNVDADTFTAALIDGMRPNHDEQTMKALEPRIAELSAIMAQMKEARKGATITLDWLPGTGTQVTVDGRFAGAPIAGEDFYQALLRIWLGPKPVQEDLKKALLGG
ncbi:MAG: chalcone isomerase family protein [Betaproteobacteria bacterium]|nr:chalcone isomerase family protein [Betaproteobacteria bacterium]MDH5210909.1 chalcone isomerase family protein [Betaproteobacteria bacterium]MDH5579934.1 chalcone isomerase family protein [Betaproteobacteria bacterium]